MSRDNARCLAWTINPNRRLNYYHFFKTDMEQSFRPTTVGKGLDYLSVHLSLFHYVSSSVNLSRSSYRVRPVLFVLFIVDRWAYTVGRSALCLLGVCASRDALLPNLRLSVRPCSVGCQLRLAIDYPSVFSLSVHLGSLIS